MNEPVVFFLQSVGVWRAAAWQLHVKRALSLSPFLSLCVCVMLHIGRTSIFWIKTAFFFFEIIHQNDVVLVNLILSCSIFHIRRSLQGFTLEDFDTYFVKSILSVYFTWINLNGCIHNFSESKCWVVYLLLEFELPLVCNSSISKSSKNSETKYENDINNKV